MWKKWKQKFNKLVSKYKELKSYKWLLRNEYITGEPDEYWDYGFNPNIVLDHWDFEEFLNSIN